MTQNAKGATLDPIKKIFAIGDTGSGKTTQFLTLAGKKYMHIFDPNALNSIQGHDIDFDQYLPSTVSASVSSLSKTGKKDTPSTTSSDAYMHFEREFDQRIKDGFYDAYDWLGFDSATTLLDLIMDRVLTLNGRFGQWPNQDDYGPQMVAFINLCRTVTAMGKGLYVTGHLEEKQDELTKRITNRPMMTGRLAVKIPLLFSEVFPMKADVDKDGQPIYSIQTVRQGTMMVARTSIKGLAPVENVTIDWGKPVEGQGIGGILQWERKQLAAAK